MKKVKRFIYKDIIAGKDREITNVHEKLFILSVKISLRTANLISHFLSLFETNLYYPHSVK